MEAEPVKEFVCLVWVMNEPFQVFKHKVWTGLGWMKIWSAHYEHKGKTMFYSVRSGDWEMGSERMESRIETYFQEMFKRHLAEINYRANQAK